MKKNIIQIAIEFFCSFIFFLLLYIIFLNVSNLAISVSYQCVLGGFFGGVLIFVFILSFGPLSSSHLNPCITLNAMLFLDFPVFQGIGYLIVQFLASLFAAFLAPLFFKDKVLGGSSSVLSEMLHFGPSYPYHQLELLLVKPNPSSTAGTVWIMELFLSFILFFFIYMVFFPAKDFYLNSNSKILKIFHIAQQPGKQVKLAPLSKQVLDPINEDDIENGKASVTVERTAFEANFYAFRNAVFIGGVVGILIWMGSGVSGAIFNPVRFLGPGLLLNNWGFAWIYITSHFIGSICGTFSAILVSSTFLKVSSS